MVACWFPGMFNYNKNCHFGELHVAIGNCITRERAVLEINVGFPNHWTGISTRTGMRDCNRYTSLIKAIMTTLCIQFSCLSMLFRNPSPLQILPFIVIVHRALPKHMYLYNSPHIQEYHPNFEI